MKKFHCNTCGSEFHFPKSVMCEKFEKNLKTIYYLEFCPDCLSDDIRVI